MKKRISTRGVIIEGDYVYLIFRRRINEAGEVREYYVMPGGGLEEGETHKENVIREVKEEFGVNVKVGEFLLMMKETKQLRTFMNAKLFQGNLNLEALN